MKLCYGISDGGPVIIAVSDDGFCASISEYDFYDWDLYQDTSNALHKYGLGEIDAPALQAACMRFLQVNFPEYCTGREIWENMTSDDPENYPHEPEGSALAGIDIIAEYTMSSGFIYAAYLAEINE